MDNLFFLDFVNGWIDRWLDGWMDGWIDGWMDQLTRYVEQINRYIATQTDIM